MRASAAEALREAVRDQRSGEPFEKALGRVIRRHEGTFADYVELIGRVRDRAKRDGSSLVDAAKALAAEG